MEVFPMKLENRLINKVAIITGGNVGIGRATSLRLAAEGADVVITGRGIEDSKKVAAEVEAMGRQALAIKMDVAIMEDAKRMVKETLDKFGKIDILCNIAGGPAPEEKPFYEKNEADWNRVVAVNLIGQFNCTRAVITHMIEKRYGKILNMASVSGILGMVNMTDYAATKGGIIAFTASLAKEVAQFNINVNAISPGTTMTRGLEMFPDRWEEFNRLSGLGRVGKPEEIAALVAYLVSDEAGYVTGQNYPICGLWNLGRV
jgi:NAD(P)-dependent dehydrogenase (short-subunit alcohol dehydrogenase family)